MIVAGSQMNVRPVGEVHWIVPSGRCAYVQRVSVLRAWSATMGASHRARGACAASATLAGPRGPGPGTHFGPLDPFRAPGPISGRVPTRSLGVPAGFINLLGQARGDPGGVGLRLPDRVEVTTQGLHLLYS